MYPYIHILNKLNTNVKHGTHPAWHNLVHNLADDMISANTRDDFAILNKLIEIELSKFNAKQSGDHIEFINKDDMTEFILRWS